MMIDQGLEWERATMAAWGSLYVAPAPAMWVLGTKFEGRRARFDGGDREGGCVETVHARELIQVEMVASEPPDVEPNPGCSGAPDAPPHTTPLFPQTPERDKNTARPPLTQRLRRGITIN